MLDKKNILLYPVSLIYGIVTGIRNFLYNTEILPSESFSIPVICVGNITIGGTGKTPHVEYLAGLLSQHFRVAVLSRGYKRKTKDFRFVDPASAANDSGDEPLQIARKFPAVTVAVGRNRVKSIKQIIKLRPETDIILLDDGFQHRRLNPGFSILLSDFSRPMAEDHLLPYGSLRESKNNMRRADIILITKTPPDISAIDRRLIVSRMEKPPYQNLYFTATQYLQPVSVFGNIHSALSLDSNSFSQNGAVLITGIANPEPFELHLKQFFSTITHLRFSDHHNFSENDVKKISGAWDELNTPHRHLVTTEKDAMKLMNFNSLPEQIKSSFFYIPVGIGFLNDDKDEFDKIIIDYVRKNKRNNRIS